MNRQNIKKILAGMVMLAVILCLCAAVAAEESGRLGDNVTWTLDDNGTMTVSGQGPTEDITLYTTAWKYRLRKLVVEEGITRIGSYLFAECKELQSVSLPDSLRSIGDAAFLWCDSLKQITIPDGVNDIGSTAFPIESWGKSLITCYTSPDSPAARALGKAGYGFRDQKDQYTLMYLFDGDQCIGMTLYDVSTKLKSLIIPDGVTTLGGMFDYQEHPKLQWIQLPDSVNSLNISSFSRLNQDFYIKCKPGSYAERFARENGLQYDNGKKKVIGYKITNVNKKIDWIVSNYITSGMTELQKVKVIHNWLVNNAQYDYSYKNHGAEGVLLKGTGVCESYAKAADLLLTRAGIANKYLSGNTFNEGHAWNLVRVDGQWYHMDATWDDPVGVGNDCAIATLRFDYFLISDKQIGEDHSWASSISADKNQVGSFHGNGDTYYYDSNGTYKLNLTKKTAEFIRAASKTAKKLTIADTVTMKGTACEVTEIAAEACSGMKKLTTLTIGGNVKTIGAGAFKGCEKLKSLTIRAKKLTAKKVGAGAFEGISAEAVAKCPKKKAEKYYEILTGAGAPQSITCK